MREDIKNKFLDFSRLQRRLSEITIQSHLKELSRLEVIYGRELHLIESYQEASELIIQCKKIGYNGKQHSDQTTGKIASHLSSFFDFCVKYNYMPFPHPFWPEHGFKRGQPEEPEYFDAHDDGDIDIMLKVLYCPTLTVIHRALIWTIYATGLRRKEIAGLNFSDLNMAERTIRVRKVVAKMQQYRYVPFDIQTADRLQQHVEGMLRRWPECSVREDFPLFPRMDGTRMKPGSIWAFMTRLRERLDIPVKINPHKWRHSVPVRLLKGGVGLPEVSKIMGHKRITTTMTYTHFRPKTLRDAIDKVPLLAV